MNTFFTFIKKNSDSAVGKLFNRAREISYHKNFLVKIRTDFLNYSCLETKKCLMMDLRTGKPLEIPDKDQFGRCRYVTDFEKLNRLLFLLPILFVFVLLDAIDIRF